MSWVQHGEIETDAGEFGGDWQAGKVASVRFVRPEPTEDGSRLMVTVYAFPSAPERPIETREGSVTTFSGYEHDLNGLGVDSMTEFMICRDVDDPGSTEEWSNYKHEGLDTGPYSGTDEERVAAAERDALGWIKRFDANRDIHWGGEPF